MTEKLDIGDKIILGTETFGYRFETRGFNWVVVCYQPGDLTLEVIMKDGDGRLEWDAPYTGNVKDAIMAEVAKFHMGLYGGDGELA